MFSIAPIVKKITLYDFNIENGRELLDCTGQKLIQIQITSDYLFYAMCISTQIHGDSNSPGETSLR